MLGTKEGRSCRLAGAGALVVAACAGALLLAAPAQAATGDSASRADGTSGVAPAVGAGGFVRDTAVCPSGKVVLGGGAQVVGSGSADFRTSVPESAPGTINGGAQSVWLTTLRNNGAVARTIGLFAVCALPPTGYEVVRKDVVVGAGGFLRDTALCTGSHVVFGGGGMVVGSGAGDFRTRVQEIAPGEIGVGQALYLTTLRNNDIVSHTIGLFAVCWLPPIIPTCMIIPDRVVTARESRHARRPASC